MKTISVSLVVLAALVGSAVAGMTEVVKRAEPLKEIVLPELTLQDANLPDVLGHLARETRRLDPKGKGINFVLASPDAKTRPVTLQLRNVPLDEAVRYVATVAGLKVRVEKHAVVFYEPSADDQKMVTRAFPVSAGAFTETIVPTGKSGLRGPEDFK